MVGHIRATRGGKGGQQAEEYASPASHLHSIYPPRTYPYNGEEEEDKKGGWLEAFIANQHMHEVGAEHPHKISPQ